MIRPRPTDLALTLLSLALIALALFRIAAAGTGVDEAAMRVEGTPVTVFRTPGGPPRPVVVIAHGFAGSQQLMRSFALTFARAGYVAVTFDFPGHGRNPHPLTGSITEADGATRRLLDALAAVAAATHGLGDGRLAVLGHFHGVGHRRAIRRDPSRGRRDGGGVDVLAGRHSDRAA